MHLFSRYYLLRSVPPTNTALIRDHKEWLSWLKLKEAEETTTVVGS